MTQKRVRTAIATGLAALALAAPALGHAAIVSVPAAAQAVPTAGQALAATSTALARDLALAELETTRSAFALADGSHRKVFEMLRGPSDLALWNLVVTVQAQQKARTFDLVTTSVKTVIEIEKNQVSPVPLPGVVWLFVMAALGIAGTRVRRGDDRASAGAAPLPA